MFKISHIFNVPGYYSALLNNCKNFLRKNICLFNCYSNVLRVFVRFYTYKFPKYSGICTS